MTIATTAVIQYERLVYKVLADHHIQSRHLSYDDWAQELRLTIYTLAQEMPTLEAFAHEYPVTYLYRKLKWTLVDLQRREQREAHDLTAPDEWALPDEHDGFEDQEAQLLLVEFYHTLTKKEQQKLCALMKPTTLSRQMKAYYRQTLRKKFEKFKNSFDI